MHRLTQIRTLIDSVSVALELVSAEGGHYRILDKKIENDILTVHFESAW